MSLSMLVASSMSRLTFAPFFSSVLHIARPRPREAPVTSAALELSMTRIYTARTGCQQLQVATNCVRPYTCR